MDSVVSCSDGHFVIWKIHGSNRSIFIIIHLDCIFICIDGHGRASDTEFIIDIEGISYSRDFIGSTRDVKSVISFDTVVLLGIDVERTWTIDGEVAFREDDRICIFITVWTGIR